MRIVRKARVRKVTVIGVSLTVTNVPPAARVNVPRNLRVRTPRAVRVRVPRNLRNPF